MNKFIKYIIVFLSLYLIGIAAGATIITFLIPTIADVVPPGMNVYIDDQPWSNGQTLDWGIIEPAATYYVNLTIQNTGLFPFTVILTDDIPISFGYYEWAENNTAIATGTTIKTWLNLTTTPTASGQQAWTTTILADQ